MAEHRLMVDGVSAVLSMLLGFVLWVRIFRIEGVRQTRLRAEMDLAREIAGDGSLDYALAGHPPILRLRLGASDVERLENLNVPLGVQSGHPFWSGRAPVAAGDLIAIFTDGLSETRDRAGAEFGMERLEQILLEQAARPLAEIEACVFDAVRRYGGQIDDQTLLLLRVR